MTNAHFESFDEVIDLLKNNLQGDEFIFKLQFFLLRRNFISTVTTNLDFDLNSVDYVISLVRRILPNARYGFDFSPSTEVKFNKEGKQISAPGQGWVKIPSIDQSVSHKNPGQAMLIALLLVLRDLEKLHEANVHKQGEGV